MIDPEKGSDWRHEYQAKLDYAKPFPQYQVITSDNPEMKLTTLSPFFTTDKKNAIASVSMTAKNIKKMVWGDILIKCIFESYSNKFLACKSLVNKNVTVSAHRALNTRRGVISLIDLWTWRGERDLEEYLGWSCNQSKKNYFMQRWTNSRDQTCCLGHKWHGWCSRNRKESVSFRV